MLKSPSEVSAFQWCQVYWFNRYHLGMIPLTIGYRDLAMYMGITVGYLAERFYGYQELIDDATGIAYFNQLITDQLNKGRTFDFGVEDYIPKVEALIPQHFGSLRYNSQVWLQGSRVIAVEPVMDEWGYSRQDLVLEDPLGHGIVVDIKSKLKKDSTTWSTSRDIDLYGNQSELYPLAWNSQKGTPHVTMIRFVYLMEGKVPIVEDRILDHRRTQRWFQGYMNTVSQINLLELTPGQIRDKLYENPHHIGPWGFPCEYRNYCLNGEHSQGGAAEFIQVERRHHG